MTSHVRGLILCALGASLWGISGIAGQYLLQDKSFSPGQLTAIRMFGAGILLMVASIIRRDGRIRLVAPLADKHNWPGIFIWTTLGLAGTQLTYFKTISLSNAPTATILEYLLPIVVVGWNCISWKRWPYRQEILCTLLAFLGTVLLVTKGQWGTLAISPAALFWGIVSAFVTAFYNIQPRPLIKKYTALPVLTWSMLMGGMVLVPLTEVWHFTGVIDWQSLAAYLVVVILGTVCSFGLYLSSARYLSAVEMTVIAAVEPLSSVVLAALFFGQTFGLMELAGIVLIIGAVLEISIRG